MPNIEPAQAPRFLDTVRAAARLRHLSRRTEKAYVGWIRRYIVFHGKRHPRDLGAPEVTAFLSFLALERHVSASTQNQALAALLFLHRDVLALELPWLDDVVRAKRPERLPVVLTRDEVTALLDVFTAPLGSWPLCSTARAFASSSALSFESRTSTSNGAS